MKLNKKKQFDLKNVVNIFTCIKLSVISKMGFYYPVNQYLPKELFDDKNERSSYIKNLA